MKTFTSPVDLDLFYLSTVFEVSDVGQGNLAISKLLALKNCGFFFAIYILLDESLYIHFWEVVMGGIFCPLQLGNFLAIFGSFASRVIFCAL
jgi:hypothetical protein